MTYFRILLTGHYSSGIFQTIMIFGFPFRDAVPHFMSEESPILTLFLGKIALAPPKTIPLDSISEVWLIHYSFKIQWSPDRSVNRGIKVDGRSFWRRRNCTVDLEGKCHLVWKPKRGIVVRGRLVDD